MIVKEAEYKNYRNLADVRIAFSPGTNVLWGMNAQGKTNILEGIYFFARGRSFRAGAERELVRFGEDMASTSVTFHREDRKNDVTMTAQIPLTGRKKLFRDEIALSGASEMIGELCAVLFAPNHLSLVSGAPGERRSFLDIAIAQLLPPYVTHLRRYNRALEQRNALIKQAAKGETVTDSEWEAFASVMAEHGAYIAAARFDYVSHMARHVERVFSEMTGGAERPELFYKTQVFPKGGIEEESEDSSVPSALHPIMDDSTRPFSALRGDETAEAHLAQLLCGNLEREIRVGYTLYGINKDDVRIRLNGVDAKQFCSQGQTRSLSLAMKLAEGEISRAVSGEYPVFLLDDVLSELDCLRREYVLSELDGRQIIVTSCEPNMYERPSARLIEISGGSVVSVKEGGD